MKPWRNKLVLIGGVAVFGLALPALGQESLLPPGFGDPQAPLPPPVATPAPSPAPTAAPPPSRPAPSGPRRAPAAPSAPSAPMSDAELEALAALIPDPIELPPESRRPVEVVGALGPQGWGFGPDLWGNANGRFLSSLMRRTDAPIASRWMSIVLRRALLSRAPAPPGVNPVDWVAERAWLLLRMGEADAARMLVQAVDVDRFTPKMFNVAVQTALATADPAALCPLIEPGRETSQEAVWALGDAMCAALAGEASRASTLIDQARRRSRAPAIDLTLAEKVIGAGANTRRAVTVQWDDVGEVTSWRFGLASATGIELPERLMNAAGPHVHAWKAQAPMLPLEQRLAAAQVAASLGVFSSASLVDIYSQIADQTEPSELGDTPAGALRQAYVGRTLGERMTALRDIWGGADTPIERHARRILTATAATRIPPTPGLIGDADQLVASMLSAGYDRQAARWAEVIEAGEGEEADLAWALIAAGAPGDAVDIGAGRIRAFADRDDSEDQLRSKLLVAALGGLGKIDADTAASLADDLGFSLAMSNSWTAMLERAARAGQPGTVALLAAIGMQTGGWAGVPPAHLYAILSAMRRVGLDYEARMIAAEALART